MFRSLPFPFDGDRFPLTTETDRGLADGVNDPNAVDNPAVEGNEGLRLPLPGIGLLNRSESAGTGDGNVSLATGTAWGCVGQSSLARHDRDRRDPTD